MIERIEALIKQKHLNQKRFCELIGVDSSYFSNWKKRGFPSARLPKAAAVLDLSLDELTRGTDMEASRYGKKAVEQHIVADHQLAYAVNRVIDERILHLFNLLSAGMESKELDREDIHLLEQLAKRMMKK
jgi:transcriptional regulator with XRE-family HTH domain